MVFAWCATPLHLLYKHESYRRSLATSSSLDSEAIPCHPIPCAHILSQWQVSKERFCVSWHRVSALHVLGSPACTPASRSRGFRFFAIRTACPQQPHASTRWSCPRTIQNGWYGRGYFFLSLAVQLLKCRNLFYCLTFPFKIYIYIYPFL